MQKILLLHGALGSPNDFDPIAIELKKAGWLPVSPCFAGHGKTPFENKMTIEGLSQQVKNIIADQGLEQSPILGYSLGGFIALKLAAEKFIEGPVITLATKIGWTEESAKREAANCVPEKLSEKVPQYYQHLMQTHTFLPELLDQTRDLLLQMPFEPVPEPTNIRNPVLLLRGELDKLVNQMETELYCSKLAKARLEVLPATAHALSTVDSGVLVAHVGAFIT